ncbi:MAG TPA: hypothetical protein VGH87_13790 [Polyangiaceae bacterium]
MVADGEAAARLAREMLAEISRDHAERFERSNDRVHELKKEIADARDRFKQEVAPAHHAVFEHEVRAWAKHSGQPKQPDATPTKGEEKKKKGAEPPILLFGALGIALVAAFAIADYVGTHREKHRGDDDDDRRPKKGMHEQTSGASKVVAIPSCQCMSPTNNPPTEVKLLAPPSDHAQPWSVDIRRNFGTLQRFALPEQTAAVLSGSSPSLSPDVGIACDGKVFVLIANDRITAWSSSDATWKWNAALPKPFSAPHVDAPPLQGSSITTTCTELSITREHDVVVPLASGDSAKVSLDDGHLGG